VQQEVENKYTEGSIILIDKAKDWTSSDVVCKIRNLLRSKYQIRKIKVGHAGTLDPLATGLVIVCTGKATKQSDSLMIDEKEYIATLQLGATTPSFDLETQINQTFPIEHITTEMINEAIKKFTGKQQQMPPAFSAKWVDGRRAYKSARKGKEVILQAVEIIIRNLVMLSTPQDLPILRLQINCSKGTYIRSLANDIGRELKSGAFLADLRRTRSGSFSIQEAITIEEFEKKLYSE